MPLQDHMQLMPTDDHLIEHPHLWTDRLPAAVQDAGPRIVEMPVGSTGRLAEVWDYEGRTR